MIFFGDRWFSWVFCVIFCCVLLKLKVPVFWERWFLMVLECLRWVVRRQTFPGENATQLQLWGSWYEFLLSSCEALGQMEFLERVIPFSNFQSARLLEYSTSFRMKWLCLTPHPLHRPHTPRVLTEKRALGTAGLGSEAFLCIDPRGASVAKQERLVSYMPGPIWIYFSICWCLSGCTTCSWFLYTLAWVRLTNLHLSCSSHDIQSQISIQHLLSTLSPGRGARRPTRCACGQSWSKAWVISHKAMTLWPCLSCVAWKALIFRNI